MDERIKGKRDRIVPYCQIGQDTSADMILLMI